MQKKTCFGLEFRASAFSVLTGVFLPGHLELHHLRGLVPSEEENEADPNATSLPRGLMHQGIKVRTPVTNSLLPKALITDPSVATLREGDWNDRQRISRGDED